MQTKRFYRLILSATLCVVLSSCGFHLRGTSQQDLSALKVLFESRSSNTEFEKILKRQLQNAGIEIVGLAALAQSDLSERSKSRAIELQADSLSTDKLTVYQLRLMSLDFTSQGVIRDATGRANEQEITGRLSYSLLRLKNSAGIVGNSHAATQSVASEAAEEIIAELTASASYYQDYRNPIGAQVQQKETRKIILQQLSQRLSRQLQLRYARES